MKKVQKIRGALLLIVLIFFPFAFLNAQVATNTSLAISNSSFETPGSTSLDALSWQSFHKGYKRVQTAHSGEWGISLFNSSTADISGAYQRIDLQQSEKKPVQIGTFIKGENIINSDNGYFGASIYAEIHLNNGSIVYFNSSANFGTFDWQEIGFDTESLPGVNAPIDYIYVVPILGRASGQAWFDDVSVYEYEFNPSDSFSVTIMIDDGEKTSHSVGKEVLDGFGFSASAAIVSDYVGEDDFMTWQDLEDLRASGWEIVSHSVSHRDLTTLSDTQTRQELRDSKIVLEEHGFAVNNFAYPFGGYNMTVESIAREYYKSARPYNSGDNPMGVDPFGTYIRSVVNTTTVADVEAWLNSAKASGNWIVLVFHSLDNIPDDIYRTSPDVFNDIISAVADSGADVINYDAGIDKYAAK